MKSKMIPFTVKNLLKSKSCKKMTASAKALCNAFGTSALLALASALAEAVEPTTKNKKINTMHEYFFLYYHPSEYKGLFNS
nr:hypothetical protein [Klebsiella variicola]